jgi:hypothetical protein
MTTDEGPALEGSLQISTVRLNKMMVQSHARIFVCKC